MPSVSSGDVNADGVSVVTLPNKAGTNHQRQYEFAVDFLQQAAEHCDLTVGFNKLLGLDVLYCADPSMHDRLRQAAVSQAAAPLPDLG